MAFTVEQIDSSEKVVEGKFTGSTGLVNPYSRGLIFEDDKIVSSSFGYSPIYTPSIEQIVDICNSNVEITTCFEGPLVKLWWDSEDKQHLSTTNRLDCTKSYWGNKDEKFGELFDKYGGSVFVEKCKNHDLTHHFMIMTRSLMVTCDLNLKDNDCMIVYLGSMTKEGYYSNIDFENSLFYLQEFNEVPNKEELNNKILYPYAWKPDNSVYYSNFISQILKYGHSKNDSITSELSEDEKFKGVDSRVIDSYFGSPVIIRTEQGIMKFVPSSYEKKCSILGNTPNINLLVYNLMDSCRPKKDATLQYFETYDFLFVPTPEFIDSLTRSNDIKTDIIKEYRSLGTVGFMEAKVPHNNTTRERNLLLILLLCLPNSKCVDAIAAYNNYCQSRIRLKQFITTNISNIIVGKYDESLENQKVISRMKDMCARSSEYARKHSNNPEEMKYFKKLEFSLSGLINNERGASLYKINKALNRFI